MDQLTESEYSRLKRDCLLLGIAGPALQMTVFIPVIWGGLTLIDRLVFGAEEMFLNGIYVVVALTIVMAVIFAFSAFYPAFDTRKQEWTEIYRKLRTVALKDAAPEEKDAEEKKFLKQLAAPLNQRLHYMAAVCEVDFRLERNMRMFLAIVPGIILAGVFVPEFIQSMLTYKLS